jgi:hypothetical protein
MTTDLVAYLHPAPLGGPRVYEVEKLTEGGNQVRIMLRDQVHNLALHPHQQADPDEMTGRT